MPKASRTPRSTQQQPDKGFLVQLNQMIERAEKGGQWQTAVLYSNGIFRIEIAVAPPNERVTGATASLRICGQALRNCLTIRSPQLLPEFFKAVEYLQKLVNSEKGKELIMWLLQHSYDMKRKRKSAERVMIEL